MCISMEGEYIRRGGGRKVGGQVDHYSVSSGFRSVSRSQSYIKFLLSRMCFYNVT